MDGKRQQGAPQAHGALVKGEIGANSQRRLRGMHNMP
jgi:hypothetical protein